MQIATKSKQEYRTSKKNKYEVSTFDLLVDFGMLQFSFNFKSL